MSDEPEILHLSITQLGRLTRCEMQWVFDRLARDAGDEKRTAKTVPLLLGTLLHRLMGAWDTGRDWRIEWHQALLEDPTYEPGFEPEEYFTRAWSIMEDWEQKFGDTPADRLVAIELPFDVEVPGVPGVRIRGFMDGLRATPATLEDGTPDPNRTHDLVRLVEYKSMGRWGREDLVPFDLQLWAYLWILSRILQPTGAQFVAISTYPYKEPSPEKRFKVIELEYQQHMVDLAVEQIRKLAKRAVQVRRRPELAVKNIGEACRYCEHKLQCLGAPESED